MTNKNKPGASPTERTGAAGESPTDTITSDQEHRLTHLLHLVNDLCLSYRTAVRRIDDLKLREELVALDHSHDRLRAQLGQLLEDLGHGPVEGGDLHGLVERGRVVVGGLQGDEGIVQAMANNEREMMSALREERHLGALPAEAMKIIEEALQHEEAHSKYYNQALQVFVG